MRTRHRFLNALVAVAVTTGILAIADPAAAALPSVCKKWDMPSGRHVVTNNNNNGNGAKVVADLCYRKLTAPGVDPRYSAVVFYTVTDTAANGAGATPRLEYTDFDGDQRYLVAPDYGRAWTYGETVSLHFDVNGLNWIANLYLRACLTNTDRPAHHCGPAV